MAHEIVWVLEGQVFTIAGYIISHQQKPGTAISHCSQGVIELHRPSLLPAAT